jgi:hypothetical protein
VTGGAVGRPDGALLAARRIDLAVAAGGTRRRGGRGDGGPRALRGGAARVLLLHPRACRSGTWLPSSASASWRSRRTSAASEEVTALEAARLALDDAGLRPSDIDGMSKWSIRHERGQPVRGVRPRHQLDHRGRATDPRHVVQPGAGCAALPRHERQHGAHGGSGGRRREPVTSEERVLGGTSRWALLLGAALAMILRAPVYFSAPSFWAEEGMLYFAVA